MTVNEQYNDEIDLYELFLVLKKRFKFIATIFIIGIFIGGLIAFLSPNIYQARATLWVDSFLMQSMLENLKSNLKGENKFSFIIPLQQNKSPEVNKLSISILNSVEFQKKVISKVQQTHKFFGTVSFTADVDKKTESIVLTSEQKDSKLAKDILQTAIEEFRKEMDKASLVYSEVLASEKINTDKSKNFVIYVVENPNSSQTPVKPKRKLIIAVSAISSLFLGIFIAFLVEWWNNVTKRKEDTTLRSQ